MAALTQWYVDPFINANSGSGTLANPYGDLQYALNTITRDATNGDQINIKAGTAELITGSLSLAVYGSPAEGVPLLLCGYTSVANDGGVAEIDANGFRLFAATTYVYVALKNLYMHNFGNNHGLDFSGSGQGIIIEHCRIQKGASSPNAKRLINSALHVIGCYIYDAGTSGVGVWGIQSAKYNYIYNCPTGIQSAADTSFNVVVDCATGITSNGDNQTIESNSVYSSSANTGVGINIASGNSNFKILNNIIEGYSGVGGRGIASVGDVGILGGNAIYNCTTPKSMGDVVIDLGTDTTPTSSPFVNAAGGNFSLNTAVVGAIENAYPVSWYGPASTTNKADRGAVQNGAGSGGGVSKSRIIGGV